MGRTSKQCPQCGSRIVMSSESVQLECAFCTATTLLVSSDDSSAERHRLSRNRTVDLSKFTIDGQDGELEIWWGWNRLKGVAAILLAITFGCFGSLYLAAAFGSAGSIAFFAGLIPSGIAVGLGYTGLAMLVNHSRIAIENRVLESTHGPLPYYLPQRLPLSRLQELVVHREVTRDSDGDVSIDYQLHARTAEGPALKLIKHQDSAMVPRAVKAVLDAHIRGKLRDDSARSKSPANSGMSAADRASGAPAKGRQKIVLICPKCGGLTPPPRKITSSKCRYCAAELAIADEIWEAVGLHPPRRRNIEHTPVNFLLRHQGRTLTVTANWNRFGAVPVLVIALLVAGCAAIGILLALWSDGWSVVEIFKGGTFVVTVASLMIGIPAAWCAYLALCQLVNCTQVTLDSDRLSVWNGPLPLRKTCQLPAAKIKQISIHRNMGYRRHVEPPGYDLDAISDYGATLELFTDQTELQGLQTVERIIERRLGLADRVVTGEVM